MLLTIIGIVTDIMLGAMAYRLARRLEVIQRGQAEIITKLTGRVEAIETHVYKRPESIGFSPILEVD